jgi:hypothetical protein
MFCRWVNIVFSMSEETNEQMFRQLTEHNDRHSTINSTVFTQRQLIITRSLMVIEQSFVEWQKRIEWRIEWTIFTQMTEEDEWTMFCRWVNNVSLMEWTMFCWWVNNVSLMSEEINDQMYSRWTEQMIVAQWSISQFSLNDNLHSVDGEWTIFSRMTEENWVTNWVNNLHSNDRRSVDERIVHLSLTQK